MGGRSGVIKKILLILVIRETGAQIPEMSQKKILGNGKMTLNIMKKVTVFWKIMRKGTGSREDSATVLMKVVETETTKTRQ